MRVLLAQTDRSAVEIFRAALEAEGHQVVVARSGEQAIRVAMEERPDVIVTELVLPTVDGWRVAQVLGSYGPLRDVPILALTSYVEPEGEAKALSAGFARYLILPIEPHALVGEVEQAGGPPAPSSRPLDPPRGGPRGQSARRQRGEAQ